MPPSAQHLTFGKVGEWLYGADLNGYPLRCSCAVTLSPYPTRFRVYGDNGFSIAHADQPGRSTAKARAVVKAILARRGYHGPPPLGIRIVDSPPESKGLGSSAVDTSVAITAVEGFLGFRVSVSEKYEIQCGAGIGDFLLAPEKVVLANPTDASFEILGDAPHTTLIAFDTQPHHPGRRYRGPSRSRLDAAQAAEFEELRALIATGVPAAIRDASTRNAELNHQIRPKAGFGWALEQARKSRSVGLVSAHQSSFLAFAVFDPLDTALIAELWQAVLGRGLKPLRFETGRR